MADTLISRQSLKWIKILPIIKWTLPYKLDNFYYPNSVCYRDFSCVSYSIILTLRFEGKPEIIISKLIWIFPKLPISISSISLTDRSHLSYLETWKSPEGKDFIIKDPKSQE